MLEWWQSQVARGFPDLAGTVVTGSIPVKEELINELIASYLAQPGDQPAPRAVPDAARLMRQVRSASVHAGPGVVTLRFEIGV